MKVRLKALISLSTVMAAIVCVLVMITSVSALDAPVTFLPGPE